MNTHTPGPWRVHKKQRVTAGPFEFLPTIQKDHPGEDIEIWDANARLIAAAPDLLAALKALVEPPTLDDVRIKDWENARAAIAKAEGTS